MDSLEVLNDDILAKIKGIQMKAKHLVSDTFAGDYLSAFKGRGMEFEEVREYTPGDDIRKIDWNVTARTGQPYIKTYRDERELTVLFVVDVSASAHFGTSEKFKNEVAAEITALLAYAALRNNDKIGLVIFSDHVEHYIPPRKGKGHVWRLIRDILTFKSAAKSTDIVVPLDFLNKVLNKKTIVFLISDFQTDGFSKELQTISKRHDVTAISIKDERELSMPNIGYIEFEDAETGEYILVNTSDKKFLANFTKEGKKDAKAMKNFFRSSGIEFVDLLTDSSYVDTLVKYFRTREKGRRS